MTDIDAKIFAAILAAIASLLVAGIAAIASLAAALVSYLGHRKTQISVESLKGDLAERKSENDARRDYVYEARKRLYQECEPLLFQFYETGENALHRVYSLARTARSGDLGPEKSWLDGQSYYMASTIYNLLAPAAIFKMIQRRLTFIDLSVEPHISSHYLLAKAIYLSFTDAFDLAAMDPKLEYTPDKDGWKQMRKTKPFQYWRQHVNLGRLDIAVEALIKKEASSPERLLSFGEFEAAYYDESSPIGQSFEVFSDLFLFFHPGNRPALWRILVAQSHIYLALPQLSPDSDTTREAALVPAIPPEKRNKFDWRVSLSDVQEAEVLEAPFLASETYLQRRLGKRFVASKN